MIQGLRIPFIQLRYAYPDPLERQRAQMLLYMIPVIGAAWLLSLIVVVLPAPTSTPDSQLSSILLTIWVPFVLFFIRRSVEHGFVNRGAILFVGMLVFATVPTAVLNPDILFVAFLLVIPLVAAGALFNRIGALITFAVLLIALFGRAVGISNVQTVIRYIPALDGASELAIVGLVMVTSAVFLIAFSGTTERLAQSSFEDVRHWQAFSRLALHGETDPDRIAGRAIEVLQKELNYSTAQVYFADETGNVTRRVRAATVDRQFNARIDDLPGIGIVAREKRGRAFRREASVVQDYPLAPARIGIAMPILYQGIVLGVLDVQTTRSEMPSVEQIAAFSAFADLLAENFMNARRQTELQKTVDDQEGVIATFRTRLTEFQSRNAQTVGNSWVRYLEGRGGKALGFDVDSPEGTAIPRSAADLPPAIRATLERGDLFIEPNADGTRTVHVPILLREEILGGMTFTLPGDRPLTDRQTDALRTIANRLGQSLENNRLFEQSQAQAARERKASSVSAQLISATNVESLLDLAAQSFNEALGAVYTRVFLEPSALSGENPRSTPSNGSSTNGSSTNGAHTNGAHERS